MHPDRWSEVEKLYHDALEREPGERMAFLDQSPDEELRREVQSLLRNEQKGDRLFENSPWKPSLGQFASGEEPGPALAAGTRLGPYEIVSPIGAGGMGEVYRARDTRLNRTVAIKIVWPSHLDSDAARKRFEHEARALSSLNHPHICALYDVGHQDGIDYLVMEYLDGETLAQNLKKGRLPLDQALRFAIEIAEALDQAHRHGVIHRDLKPGNIMVTRDGHVKVLDFGLAKQRRPAAESATLSLTEQGAVVGTAGYMSPEQVRGEESDQCSDLFSFGVVLYEMLSGKQAFAGGSSVEVMHAVLKNEPPDLPLTVPPALEHIVRRCLEKDPTRRFQTAADLEFALHHCLTSSPARAVSKRRAWPKWAMAASVLAAGVAFVWLSRPLPPPRVTGIIQITHDNKPLGFPPFLSDGSHLFFSSSNLSVPAYQVSVKGGEAVPLKVQTKSAAYLLDINPDRTEFLLCRRANPGCELWTEPILGGSPRRLGNLVVDNASAVWSPDGKQLVFARDEGLHLANSDGTGARRLAAVAGQPIYPHWSPDGRRIRFAVTGDRGKPARMWEVLADGSGLHAMLPGWNPTWNAFSGNWTGDGVYFVFSANERLWVVREKTGIFRRAGEPVQLNTGQLAATNPVLSADGKRIFFAGVTEDRNEFLRYDIKTGRFALDLPGVSGTELEYSRDGKWVTYVSTRDGSLFRSAADGSDRLQLTSPPLGPGMPHWSPDGRQIAFHGSAGGQSLRIYVVPFDGGVARQVTNGESGNDGDPTWSPDGSQLAFGTLLGDTTYVNGDVKKTDAVIHVVDLKTGHVSTLPGSQDMWAPRWSPDGRFIAGLSGSTSKLILYEMGTRTQTELFHRDVGCPTWSNNGEFLFLYSAGGWWRVRLRDRKAELVNSLNNISLAGWGWFAIAPNDSLITARDIGTSEIYALNVELP